MVVRPGGHGQEDFVQAPMGDFFAGKELDQRRIVGDAKRVGQKLEAEMEISDVPGDARGFFG